MKLHRQRPFHGRLAVALVAAALGAGVAVSTHAQPQGATPAPAAAAPRAPAAAPAPAPSPAPSSAGAAQASSAPDIRVQIVAGTIATIGAPMSGRLNQFPLRDGERFKQGQVLARFVCAEKQSALAHAKAVLQGRKSINASKQRLRALGTSSEVEYQVAQSDEEQATADVQAAQTLVDDCTVAAPFAGRVSAIYTHNFQYLQTGAPMLELLSDTSLDLEMIVPSQWLAWLKPGATFKVAIDETGKTYPATLTRLSGKVDAVSRSIKVYGHIDNPPETLLPGMSGHASFTPPAGVALGARP